MSRLIDADKLLEPVGSYNPKKYTWEYGMVVTVEDIKKAHTVDAEPIRHGHWVEQEQDDWRYSKEYRCSECGKYRLVTNPAGWEWHYCPNCGARMDEDSNTHNTDSTC